MNRQKSGQQAVPVSPLGNSYLPRVWMTTGLLFSQYSSTLYNVTMEAVTQSLLSSRHISSRKKSPAWKHFFISPQDSTKAICTYCMKEFSRGKNEKDLSTSCLMRHVRGSTPHQAHSRKWKSIGRVLLFPSLSFAFTTACRCGRPSHCALTCQTCPENGSQDPIP